MAIADPHLLNTSLLDCLAKAGTCLGDGDRLLLCLAPYAVAPGLDTLEGRSDQNYPLTFISRLLGRCGFESVALLAGPERDWNDPGRLFCLRRAPQAPRWRLSHVDAAQFPAFAGLFTTVFGQVMTPGLWSWKYGAGRGCAIGAWRGDKLIAHYGGNLRRVMAFGQPILALQVCDAMVDPGERAVMTKTGAMYQVTAAFLELYQGLASIPLAFGFPNRRAMRLGERLGFYAEVGALVELRWPPLDPRPRLATRLTILDPKSSVDRLSVDRLWSAMARDLVGGVIGVRDWEQVRYRYLDHPERHYELVLIRSRLTRVPLGLLVLHEEADAMALTDLVAPLRHLPTLLVQARRLTGLRGKSSLYGWMTRQQAFRLTTPDTALLDIDVSIPTNVWVPQPFSPAQLVDRWWLTIGDTDFL